MKKLLGMIAGLAVLIGLGNISQADCLSVTFDNGDRICVALNKNGNRYYASVQENLSPSARNESLGLRCEIILPNNVIEDLGPCDGYFSYVSNSTENITLHIRYGTRYFETVDARFNFSNGTWASGGGGGGSTNANLSLSTSNSYPSTNQYVNLTVNTNSSYREYVYFSLEYKDGSTWRTAPTSYYEADSYFTRGYQFTSSDYGQRTFNSFIRFNNSYLYRLYVEDRNGNRKYIEFDVTGGSSYNNLSISSSNSYPSTNQYVNVTVNTNSSYRDYVYFSLEYQDGSTWRTAPTSYYEADNYFNRGYQFTSSDYGQRTFNSFIRFYNNYRYRLYVEDRNGNRKYIEFDVTGGSSYNNLSISSSNSYPSTNQYVNITVNTDSSYRDYVYFSLEYRDGSTWRTAPTSYYEADSYFSRGYQFSSSDYGQRTFNSFIRFNNNYLYRLYVEDRNGNRKYIEFDVTGGSSYNNLSISSSNSYPSTNQYLNITVNTNSSYRGRVNFYVQYRSSTSSSWYTVSDSSYFTADSYLANGYQFTSSDYGQRIFYSLLKFNRSGYFRLVVRDNNGNEQSVQFNVDTGSSNNGNLSLRTSNSAPSTNQWVNLTITTDSSYRDYVYFSLEYKDGSTWRSASTSYYEADTYFNRGYQFTSSDYGQRTLNSFIRFNRNYLYRLYVEDRYGNKQYIEFDVGGNNSNSESNVRGFTTTELRKITNVSRIWYDVVAELKRTSSKLRTDSYWQRLSDTLYTNMRDVVDNRSYRVFGYYSDFLSAFNEWYTYTARNA